MDGKETGPALALCQLLAQQPVVLWSVVGTMGGWAMGGWAMGHGEPGPWAWGALGSHTAAAAMGTRIFS